MNKLIVIQNGKQIETESISGLNIEWLGNGGMLKVHAPLAFSNTTIQIGDGGIVEISENSHIKRLFLRCASTASSVKIGKNFNIESGEFILAKGQEDQSIVIGDNCLFSSNIFIQTSDGHTILDMNGNVLNNCGGKIVIGNHVWLGYGVSILKKASIANNTIVAESSTVTKPFSRSNCILCGVPAKIIKINVDWNIKSPRLYQMENCKNG